MTILAWTPRGFEFIDFDDFHANWIKVNRGFWTTDTYDRRPGVKS